MYIYIWKGQRVQERAICFICKILEIKFSQDTVNLTEIDPKRQESLELSSLDGSDNLHDPIFTLKKGCGTEIYAGDRCWILYNTNVAHFPYAL